MQSVLLPGVKSVTVSFSPINNNYAVQILDCYLDKTTQLLVRSQFNWSKRVLIVLIDLCIL